MSYLILSYSKNKWQFIKNIKCLIIYRFMVNNFQLFIPFFILTLSQTLTLSEDICKKRPKTDSKMYHLLSDNQNQWKFKPPRDSMINPRAQMTFLFKKLVFPCASINKKNFIEPRRDFSLNTALKNLRNARIFFYKIHKFQF